MSTSIRQGKDTEHEGTIVRRTLERGKEIRLEDDSCCPDDTSVVEKKLVWHISTLFQRRPKDPQQADRGHKAFAVLPVTIDSQRSSLCGTLVLPDVECGQE